MIGCHFSTSTLALSPHSFRSGASDTSTVTWTAAGLASANRRPHGAARPMTAASKSNGHWRFIIYLFRLSGVSGDQSLVLKEFQAKGAHRRQLALKLPVGFFRREDGEEVRQLYSVAHDLIG